VEETSGHSFGLTEVTHRECVELLRSQPVGRLGVVVKGRPEIFPVNYTLDASDSVVLRTAVGMKLVAAVNHPVVFEVDWFDPDWRSGWSVIVHGVAHHTGSVLGVDDPSVSWRDDTPYLVRITSTSVTGRRIRRHP
jgi:hypothetical protein